MDLLKSFDCIDHELLIVKQSAYGFCNDALLMIYSSISSSAPLLRRSTSESAAVHANQLCGAFMRSQSRNLAARLESLRFFFLNNKFVIW